MMETVMNVIILFVPTPKIRMAIKKLLSINPGKPQKFWMERKCQTQESLIMKNRLLIQSKIPRILIKARINLLRKVFLRDQIVTSKVLI